MENRRITLEKGLEITESNKIQRFEQICIAGGHISLSGSCWVSVKQIVLEGENEFHMLVRGSITDPYPVIRIGIENLTQTIRLKNETPVGSEVIIRYETDNESDIHIIESGSTGRVWIIKNGISSSNRPNTVRPARKLTPGARCTDYTDAKDLHELYNRYGGEEVLKENYPQIYANIQKGIESPAKSKETDENESDIGIYSFEINPLTSQREDSNDEFYTLSNKTDFQLFKSNVLVARFWGSMHYNNGDNIKSFDERYPVCELNENNNPFVKLQRDLRNIYLQEGTKIVTESYLDIYYNDGSPPDHLYKPSDTFTIFKGSTVVRQKLNAPVARSKSSAVVTVGYWHSGCDYDYSVGTDVTSVPIKLDFSGTADFPDDFTITKAIMSGTEPLRLRKRQDTIVTHSCTVEESENCISKPRKNSISYTFPVNWNKSMSLAPYLENRTMEVSLKCALNIDAVDEYGINYPITLHIESAAAERYYESEGSPDLYLPPIKIIWDCYAAGALAALPGGKTKPIEQLKKGDTVLAPDGSSQTVKAVFGKEDDSPLNFITVTADNNKTICVTEHHSLIGADGNLVNVSTLKPGDKIKCGGGTTVSVKSLQKKVSKEKVYNLIIGDKGGLFTANGFIVPDSLYGSNLPKPLPQDNERTVTKEEENALMRELMQVAEDNRIIGLNLNPPAILVHEL